MNGGRVFDVPVVMRNAIFDAGSNNSRAFRFDNCRGHGVRAYRASRLRPHVDRFHVLRLYRHLGFANARAWFEKRHYGSTDATASSCRNRSSRTFGRMPLPPAVSRRVSVLRNYGTNFSPINTGGNGDHPDFIQFWAALRQRQQLHRYRGQLLRARGWPAGSRRLRSRNLREGWRALSAAIRRGQHAPQHHCRCALQRYFISGVNAGEIVDNVVVSARDAAGNLIDKHSWLRADRCAPTVTIARNRAEAFIGDVDETLNTRAVVQHWPKAPQIDCGLRSGLPDPVEPPARSKPQGPDTQQGGTAVEQLRQKLAARDRLIDERFASAGKPVRPVALSPG